MSLDRLTDQEWEHYSGLVNQFSDAKLARRFDESDQLRAELHQWQEGVQDQQFIDMSQSGSYRWHPVFETQGEDGNRRRRLERRKASETDPVPTRYADPQCVGCSHHIIKAGAPHEKV